VPINKEAQKLIMTHLKDVYCDLELKPQHIFDQLQPIYKLLVENKHITIAKYPYELFQQVVIEIFRNKQSEHMMGVLTQ